jgi:hypothetical protein
MAKLWLHDMVVTAGTGTAGCVLAATWHTGELDRNFIIIHTSSCTVENIIGVCNYISWLINTSFRDTCCNLFWGVQQTFLKMLVSCRNLIFETLISPNWKWWVQDSSRWVARILDWIICLLCVYICHYIFPFYYLDILFFFLHRQKALLYKSSRKHTICMCWKFRDFLSFV